MSLLNGIARTLRAISPFHDRRGVQFPNGEHLDENPKIFRAPITQSKVVLQILQKDEDFLNALPDTDKDCLMMVAVVGDEIRVNVFYFEEFGSLLPVYNPNWMNHGKIHYHLRPDHTIELIRRKVPGKFYHPEDPRLSFTHRMTYGEKAQVDLCLMNR